MKFEINEYMLNAMEAGAKQLRSLKEDESMKEAAAQEDTMGQLIRSAIEEAEQQADVMEGFVTRARKAIKELSN